MCTVAVESPAGTALHFALTVRFAASVTVPDDGVTASHGSDDFTV
jgi:hypothetical protein